MKKKRKIVPAKIKETILSELEIPSVIISEVAAKYKISTGLLYKWRSKRREFKVGNLEKLVKGKDNNAQANFVELSVNQAESTTAVLENPKKLLKKLTLEFEDMSLSIDGSISSKKLMELITVLEVAC